MDILDRPHIDYVGDVRDLSFFEDGCVEEIYACHVLEHIGRNENEDVLAEWYRVLQGGGVLRIAVPDFAAVVTEYAKNGSIDTVMGLLYGGQNYEHNFHYQVFDYERLKRLLEETGFSNIRKYAWNDFLPADYDDFSRAYLPHMDIENGRLMSLNVTAEKI